jgi:hypothetical protein
MMHWGMGQPTLVHAGREGEEHGNARRRGQKRAQSGKDFRPGEESVYPGKFRLPLEALSMLIKLQPQAQAAITLRQVRQAAVHLGLIKGAFHQGGERLVLKAGAGSLGSMGEHGQHGQASLRALVVIQLFWCSHFLSRG